MIAVPGSKLIAALDYALASVVNGLVLKLYSNNVTPSETSVAGDFTECAFDGYAAVTMSAWPGSAIVSGEAVSTQPIIVFLQTGTVTNDTVFGYFVVDGSNNLQYADRNTFMSGVAMDTAGKTYTVKPRFGLKAQS